MPAQMAIVGAHVRTMDDELPTASALAITDGVITAVGDDAAIREVIDGTTEVINGSGWTLTPGLVDGHQHLFMGAEMGRGVSFDRVDSLEDVRARLAQERRRVGAGAWIVGYAFEYAALEGADFHHQLIDAAAGDGPMFIFSLDVHTGFTNAHGLRQAGITGSREFPDGSFIVVDDEGAPTGELREMSAMRLALDARPAVSDDERLDWYADAIAAQNAVGITGIHQMDATLATADVLTALEGRGDLGMRVNVHWFIDPSLDAETLNALVRGRDLSGRRWRSDGAKFMIDGVIDTGTAWLEEPDTHGDGGEAMWPDIRAYRETVALFANAGFAVTTHAIGDRAIREVLDTYDGLGSGVRPPRIEHIETAPDATIARFAPQGVIASMQPIHLRWLSPNLDDPWSQRLGQPRCDHVMRSGDLSAAGALVVLGSDWPVAPYDPRLGFLSAQLRRAPDRPAHTAIGSSLETLAGYTINPARATGSDSWAGSLSVGKQADLVAWGADPVATSPQDVVDLPITLTMVDGEIVHRTGR